MIHLTKIKCRKLRTKFIGLVVILGIALSASGCSDKVTEDAAREAGKVLKKWQDQNK